jgi:hypothetical protein
MGIYGRRNPCEAHLPPSLDKRTSWYPLKLSEEADIADGHVWSWVVKFLRHMSTVLECSSAMHQAKSIW